MAIESSAGGGAGGSPVTDQREPLRERSASREHRPRRAVSASRPVSCKFNNRDASFTQFAVIDDDNVSALQQVTRGGGGQYRILVFIISTVEVCNKSSYLITWYRSYVSISVEISV